MADLGKYVDATIPSWIEWILENLRWQVLAIDINVGYWLRFVINWILARINERHIALFNNDTELANRIQQHYNAFQGALQTTLFMVFDLFRRVDALEARVNGIIDISTDWLHDLVSAWTRPTRELALANYTDIKALRAAIEGAEIPWWRPDQILLAITEGIGNIINPGGESEQDTRNLFQWLWLFFKDPPKFLYSMADEMVTRFW